MKNCFKCGNAKPLTDFYTHAQMKDGHLNKCKECTKGDANRNRERNIERIRNYDRNRPNKKERSKINYENLKRKRELIKGFSTPHIAVRRALKKGQILKPERCERCKMKPAECAHHDDYSKLLDVMWLCEVCHKARHKELGWGIPGKPARR